MPSEVDIVLAELDGTRVLLLQGPMGPYFRRFSHELRAAGAIVTKINLNAGDQLFFGGEGAIPYRGTLDTWPEWLRAFLSEGNFDFICLYGGMRPYHRAAKTVAESIELPLYVFEDGYLRPNHYTCELGGVNGNSPMPKDPETYRQAGLESQDQGLVQIGPTFARSAWLSTAYSMAATLLFFRYPRYVHHRPLNCFYHAYVWVRGALRKQWFGLRERDFLTKKLPKRYFFVPLQVGVDSQILHSDFDDVVDFVELVTASFAKHADSDCHIVFKHHPADRAYRDYTKWMRRLASTHELQGRLHYVHDVNLTALLDNAIGTITINSTTGLASLDRGIPVKCMGRSIYNLAGLVDQGPLEHFWHQQRPIDTVLWRNFQGWLEQYNQINGNVWKRLPGHSEGTGSRWPFPNFFSQHRTGRPLPTGDCTEITGSK